MADYDFRTLSPHDFEQLCRDLLQKAQGVKLESFTTGRDSGIDFRYRATGVNLIVQCKHYADTGFDGLARVLAKKERAKIEALAPTRYILTTSVGLTPPNKDELLGILAPYCLGTSDILGRDDINNLLGDFPEVERQHFKLWLTSAAVLERVLNAGIFGDSETHLDRIRQRLSRYVPNPSFDRALTLLDKSHFCIVAGIPGIGKTTLAEVVLADLVDRQGFSAYRVAHDLSELRAIKNPKSRQVFYFDDFLGKTSLDKLQKNEDQRLVELMEEVAANPNWRFILTTREYLLNTAKSRYEAFAHPSIAFRMCVINLSDYTRPVRAKILYNHIYFSDLPREYKLALLEEHSYEKILAHRNYNPRVIEYMTQWRHASETAPTLYLREFVDSLDNPERIWDHAFRRQISEAARHLLMVLATLPDETELKNLEKAFWKFYAFRQRRYGFPTMPGDFDEALKELDGNFIKTARVGDDIVISFHSPSVKDFMEGFLAKSDGEVMDLFRAAEFFEQYGTLWTGRRGHRYADIDRAADEYLKELGNNFSGPSARTLRRVNQSGETIGVGTYPPSLESRAIFYIRVVEALKPQYGEEAIDGLVKSLSSRWEDGSGGRDDVIRLLEVLTKRGLRPEDALFKAARQFLLKPPETDEEFRAAADFVQKYPEVVSGEELEALKKQFSDFAADHPLEWDDDPDVLRGAAGDIEYVGERLGIWVEHFTSGFYERADEIESERAEQEPDGEDDDWGRRSSTSYVDDVRGMFDGLESDLKEK